MNRDNAVIDMPQPRSIKYRKLKKTLEFLYDGYKFIFNIFECEIEIYEKSLSVCTNGYTYHWIWSVNDEFKSVWDSLPKDTLEEIEHIKDNRYCLFY